MQWDTSANAGFTTGKPWMRIHDDYKEWNVEVQSKDPKSVNSFYKQLLKVRKDNLVMVSDHARRSYSLKKDF
jgi:glycosidase